MFTQSVSWLKFINLIYQTSHYLFHIFRWGCCLTSLCIKPRLHNITQIYRHCNMTVMRCYPDIHTLDVKIIGHSELCLKKKKKKWVAIVLKLVCLFYFKPRGDLIIARHIVRKIFNNHGRNYMLVFFYIVQLKPLPLCRHRGGHQWPPAHCQRRFRPQKTPTRTKALYNSI